MRLHAGSVCLSVPPSSHSKSASTWTYPQATPWTDTFQLPAHCSPPCMSTQAFMLWSLSYLAFIRILFTFFSIKKTSADVCRTHLCLYFILTHLSSFSLFIKMHHFWNIFVNISLTFSLYPAVPSKSIDKRRINPEDVRGCLT